MNLDFEKYFQQKLKEEQEVLQILPYSTEQLKEIYLKEHQFIKNKPPLNLKIEPQNLSNEIMEYYLPEKLEMPRKGRLLYSDEELQQVLKLFIFNLGVKKSLDVIPEEMIKQYLNNNKR